MYLNKRIMRTLAAVGLITFGMWSNLVIVAQDAVTAQAYRTVNVRSGPSTTYSVIGQLLADTIVEVTGRSDAENNWLRINFEDQSGWVAYFTVVVTGDLETLPTVEAVPPAVVTTTNVLPLVELAQGVPEGPIVTSFRRVNIRSGPGTDFGRLDMLEPGETAPIIGRTEDNEWLQIEFEGQTGWVAYFVISVTGALDDVPTVEFTTVEPDSTQSVELEADALAVRAPLLITRFNSNLRSAPSFRAEVLVVIPFDTALEIEARTPENNWLRVTYEGQTGWLLTSLASVAQSVDLDSLPIDAAVSS
jgi:uncharacterized protein YraI